MTLVIPVLSFVLGLGLMLVLLHPTVRRWFLDHPNHRSLHASPRPRSGGLAMVAGALVALAVLDVSSIVLFGALALALVSLADDLGDVPAGLRLLVQVAVASGFVVWGVSDVGWMLGASLVIASVWMINLFNFMDGADGLAGGMATIGFGTYAAAAWLQGDPALTTACLAVAASALAFLVFNFPPARIFMGDVGSIPMGFLVAAIGLLGWDRGVWGGWFPVVVFSPFVVDASSTLIRRIIRREPVWQAHRSHYYQRQVLMGWTHRQLALAEYLLMLVSAFVALLALDLDANQAMVPIGALGLLYVGLMVGIDLRCSRREVADA